VRIRGEDWAGKPVAIVTEIKKITHYESDTGYTAVTAMCAGEFYTFSERDFDLVTKVERIKS